MRRPRDSRSMQAPNRRTEPRHDCAYYASQCLMDAAKAQAQDVRCIGCQRYKPQPEPVMSLSTRPPATGIHGCGEGGRRMGHKL